MRASSGLNCTTPIGSVWPRSVVRAAPVTESQILMVWSELAVAIRRPSWLNVAAESAAVWPSSDSSASSAGIASASSERSATLGAALRACASLR